MNLTYYAPKMTPAQIRNVVEFLRRVPRACTEEMALQELLRLFINAKPVAAADPSATQPGESHVTA
jgi:hypothetical protein